MAGEVFLGALNLRELEDAIASASSLKLAAPLSLVGTGFFSHVCMSANGWIVRVARTTDAAERHAREAALLPALAERLPVGADTVRHPVRSKAPRVLWQHPKRGFIRDDHSDIALQQRVVIRDGEEVVAARLVSHVEQCLKKKIASLGGKA